MVDNLINNVNLSTLENMLKTTVVGNYPKISSDKNAPNLRNALNLRDQGRITAEKLDEIYQDTIRRVIKEQEDAGVDIITDGQIRWDDLATPVAKNIDGIEIGGLIRFFDNNVYYRRPVAKSKVSLKNYSTVEQFKFAQANAKKPVKAVLPGPYTLAKLSLDEHYHNLDKLTLDLAEILNQEAKELEKAGAKYIQLDEPSLCYNPDKVDLAIKAIAKTFEDVTVKKILFLYFGPVRSLFPKILNTSVDVIGVDVVSKPENLDVILNNDFNQELILGCLDARNTKIESEQELFAIFDKATKRIAPEKIYISPCCGLEFLPHEAARKKLQKMAEAVKNFQREFLIE